MVGILRVESLGTPLNWLYLNPGLLNGIRIGVVRVPRSLIVLLLMLKIGQLLARLLNYFQTFYLLNHVRRFTNDLPIIKCLVVHSEIIKEVSVKRHIFTDLFLIVTQILFALSDLKLDFSFEHLSLRHLGPHVGPIIVDRSLAIRRSASYFQRHFG